jgi:xanthine dehydrogenase YagR molybdenum-binding subunit
VRRIRSPGHDFAEVAVDERLGAVRVRRIDGWYDAGRIINPKFAHRKTIGRVTSVLT